MLVDENDDIAFGSNVCSRVYAYLEAGATYEAYVVGYGGNSAVFTLQVEAYPTAATGEACIVDNTYTAGCAETDFCGPDGVCVARYADGEACAGNSECADNLYCFEEVCSTYPVEGEVCDRFDDYCQGDTYCDGNFTDGYTCRVYPQLGEECNLSLIHI